MKYLINKSDTFIFIALFIIAFAVRVFYLAYFNFDGLYGQDAYAYLEYSNGFYNSIINFKIPQNYYWPIGFYLFSTLFSFIAAGKTALASLLVSLNAGALTAGFMYLLSIQWLGRYYTGDTAKKYSIVSGLLICFAGITVKQSDVIMSDSLALMFLTLSALYAVRYIYNLKRSYIIYSFSALAFAAMTRYAGMIFIVPVIVLLTAAIIKSKNKSIIVKDVLIAAAVGILIFLPQLLYIINGGIPYLQFSGNTPTWAASWSPVNIFRSEFFTFDGTQNYRFINGLFYLTPSFHPMFLSLFGFAFISGLFKILKKQAGVISIFLLSWIAVYVLYFAGNPYQSIRYTLSFFPPLVLIAVYGLAGLKLRDSYKTIFISAGIIVLFAYSLYDFSKFAERKNKEKECIEWIQNHVRPGSNLFTFEITGAVNYYTGHNAKEFFYYNYSDIKKAADTTNVSTYFLLPVNRIETQWEGLPVKKSFDSLKTGLNPVSIGKVNDYEGFLIAK